MSSTVLISILQVAAGGSLVQILIRFGAFLYKRFSGPEERKAGASTDAISVDTAADVLVMVRGELKEVRAQHAVEKQEWDTERAKTIQSLENAAREVQRAHAALALCKSDLAVARGEIANLGGQYPGRHRSAPDDPYINDWRRGP